MLTNSRPKQFVFSHFILHWKQTNILYSKHIPLLLILDFTAVIFLVSGNSIWQRFTKCLIRSWFWNCQKSRIISVRKQKYRLKSVMSLRFFSMMSAFQSPKYQQITTTHEKTSTNLSSLTTRKAAICWKNILHVSQRCAASKSHLARTSD